MTGADLLKVHPGSGKLSLMSFDDFEGSPLPRMTERVKVRLREQRVELYEHGPQYEPPFLYMKSRYIPEDFPHHEEQRKFDRALAAAARSLPWMESWEVKHPGRKAFSEEEIARNPIRAEVAQMSSPVRQGPPRPG